jgi:general secretion pathway protein B
MSFILNALKKAESDKRQRHLPGIESYQQPMTAAWWRNVDPLKWLSILIVVINIIGLILYSMLKQTPESSPIKQTAEFDIVSFQPQRYIQNLPGFEQGESSLKQANESASKINQPNSGQTTNSRIAQQPGKMKPGEVIVADLQNESTSNSSNYSDDDSELKNQPAEPQSNDWDYLDEYSDLPLAWQQELPDMSFAAHVYMENPAASFIIVNGQNLSAGDSLGEINLIAVHEKGAIFQMRGRKFKVKF